MVSLGSCGPGSGGSSPLAMSVTRRSWRSATKSSFCDVRLLGQGSLRPTGPSAVLASVFDSRRLHEVFLIVKPETVLGWHPRVVARHWTQPPSRCRPAAIDRGNPPARDPNGGRDPTWGTGARALAKTFFGLGSFDPDVGLTPHDLAVLDSFAVAVEISTGAPASLSGSRRCL
jgi:hypothetical protein